jgi:hypothetical protein
MSSLVVPENELERRIVADPEWRRGAAWGEPRPGHPEGGVEAHVADVLEQVDAVADGPEDRARLRLAALVHDTFKHQVDYSRPRSGPNHHAVLARRFAERYVEDPALLQAIELHDEAYNAWAKGERSGRWDLADARAHRLIETLGPQIGFYLRFYRADNATGTKSAEPLEWFEGLVDRSG